VLRAEDSRLLRGQGRFVDNLTLPGMLHMVLVRSPHAHARIRDIDLGPALSTPGVVAAFSGADLAGRLPPLPAAVILPGTVIPEHRALAVERVLAVGEPVAVVLALDAYRAADGADLVDVDYEVLAAVVDPMTALAPGAPLVHPDLGSNWSRGHRPGWTARTWWYRSVWSTSGWCRARWRHGESWPTTATSTRA
jgi:carbon-monoxide dehydrogenase large subunit